MSKTLPPEDYGHLAQFCVSIYKAESHTNPSWVCYVHAPNRQMALIRGIGFLAPIAEFEKVTVESAMGHGVRGEALRQCF